MKQKNIGGKVLLFFCLFLIGTSCQRVVNNPPRGEKIVAFGDSLTAGQGADEGKTYPDILSELLDEPVINRGVSSDTTADGLRRLDADVLSENPRIVIVWLGANDVLRQLPVAETIRHLTLIVETLQSRGILVVLVGIPDFPFRPSTNDGVIQLAKAKGCVYVPNPLKGILADPGLKSDQIHPNSKGYRIIAERISKKVRKYAARS